MGLLDALADKDFRSQVGSGLLDALNRGAVGGVLGAPVDAAAGVVNAGLMGAGYLGNRMGIMSADQMPQPITQPVGGSEWLGQKMQDAGLVSPERNSLAEALASIAGPGAMVKTGRALPADAEGVADLLSVLRGPSPGSRAAQTGAIYPEGKARLLQDLQNRQSSGRYQLGDVTEGQGAGLNKLFGSESPTRDVYMNERGLDHLVARRMGDRGYTPEQVASFVEQAMARQAKPDLNVAKSNQNPSLLGPAIDPVTGQLFSSRLPLRSVDDGYEVRTVVAEGLKPPKNNKAPGR